MKKITVLLSEDHAIVRQGLCKLLETDGSFEVVGQAQTGREAILMAAELRPEVILMDIAMPELNGLEAARQILNVNSAAKIIMLSAHSDDAYVERARAVGAVGFLEKQTSADILTQAIHEVAKGKTFYSPIIAKRLVDGKRRAVTATARPNPTPRGSPRARPKCSSSWPRARPTSKSPARSASASRRWRSTGST